MKKGISFLILCGMVIMTSCSEKKAKLPNEKFKTIEVTEGNQILYSDYPVSIQGRQTVEIRPQVSGTITDILISEGDTVKRGQVLLIIDQVPYKAALETALANVKSAEAKLQTAKLNADSKEKLYKENIISDFERQTTHNLLLEAEAALAQAKAQETNARNDLSYTEVKSPVNGVAGMIPYRIGALVSSNISEPLVTVSDDSEVYAYFSMTESKIQDMILQYGSLEEVQNKLPEVRLIMSNGKEYTTLGRIDAISGIIDSGTGSVGLRAVFRNDRHLLRNGGSGVISVPTKFENCIIIPQSATYELQNRIFTWKVVDGKTKSTPITVYKYNDGKSYIVQSGLEKGDTIVAEGAGLLSEGITINIGNTSK